MKSIVCTCLKNDCIVILESLFKEATQLLQSNISRGKNNYWYDFSQALKNSVFTLRFDKWRIKALISNHCHVTAWTTKTGKTQHDQKSKLQQNYSYFNRDLKTALKLEVIPARVVCITHLSSCECCDTDILNKRKQFNGSARRFWGFDVWKLLPLLKREISAGWQFSVPT